MVKVLLAGAAGRIGAPLTQHLIDQGHEILACDIHSENEWSIDCSYAQLNLLNTDKLCEIIEENGPFKAAINCSYPKNSAFGTAFEELSLNDFQENLNLHLGAYFNLAQQIVPHFQKYNGGHLIQFSSIYGFVAPRFWIYEESKMDLPVEYSMIKAAIQNGWFHEEKIIFETMMCFKRAGCDGIITYFAPFVAKTLINKTF